MNFDRQDFLYNQHIFHGIVSLIEASSFNDDGASITKHKRKK